jgi:hypothetical protein
MSQAPPPPPTAPVKVEINVPESQSAGVYANGFASWFNQTDFTLDCFVYLPADQQLNDEGEPFIRQPVQVVARVKLPPSLVFRLIQNLEESMTKYEMQFGEIAHLGPPTPPPQGNQPPAG